MTGKDCIESFHFDRKFKIHGHLTHDQIPDGIKRWFVYGIENVPCHKQIVGYTTNPVSRWSTHKSTCNSKNQTPPVYQNTSNLNAQMTWEHINPP